MSEEDLLQENRFLSAENKRLQEENVRLRSLLQTSTAPASPALAPSFDSLFWASASNEGQTLHSHSAPQEKIAFLMSLFSGRQDVYARRWYSAKTQKSGYQPVCGNEWEPALCDKRQFKCAACPSRKLLPLNAAAIERHLRGKDEWGRDVLGIYPMLTDETCRFLAVDFDDEHFEADATAFRASCAQWNIPCCTERSRSGQGAHVWIFFSAPVPASLARKLGSGLLTNAMNQNPELSFHSYDRLFPNQDTMPTGGFGSLIALPLQGRARKEGNSLFVDERFIPYPDQWAYLSGIKKLTPADVENTVMQLCPHTDLGTLLSSGKEEDVKPWEPKRAPTPLTKADFPCEVTLTKANLLYLEKAGLSPSAQNRIKRLAAFPNPEFYRAQAMRFSTHDKPRVISTAEITAEYIGLPRGTEQALLQLLAEASVSVQVQDKTNPGTAIDVTFNGALRGEQSSAAAALLQYNNGVLSATTAFGKTVIAAYLIGQRKTNTLVLVHTQALLSQWQRSLEQFLTNNEELPPLPQKRGRKKLHRLVGQLGAGKKDVNGIVDIAVMQSLTGPEDVSELVRNYGMVIVDECHHVSAVNFEKILRATTARYVYGLTATPTRQDGHHPIIYLQCGAIRYRVDARAQAAERPFDHFLIPRFTKFRCFDPVQPIAQLYTKLARDPLRNQMILQDIAEAVKHGRNPIVLTERTEHVAALARLLTQEDIPAITLTGTQTSKEKRAVTQQLETLPADAPFVLIATGKYVGEGFDFPRLDTLFLALPIAWKGKVAQYAGRLHRLCEGKHNVQIYDYADIHVPVLERMYHKRIKSYAAIGYQTRASSQTAPANLIFNGDNFLKEFCADTSKAEKEILIACPTLRKARLTQLLPSLADAMLNHVQITVITRPAESFSETTQFAAHSNMERLKAAGIRVRSIPHLYQKFAVIDRHLIWYGSAAILASSSAEESILRLESLELANELLSAL